MPDQSPYTEKQLLAQVAEGDEAAYTVVYRQYAPEVFNAAMVYLKDAALANEVVQEVFMKVWLKKETMSAIENFKDYLFILARNRIYDGFKKTAIEQLALKHIYERSKEAITDDTHHRLEDRQYQEVLQSAIDQLTPARKKIYLARNAGKSYEEIAQEYGVSLHTAKKQMSQASRFVQEYITRYLHIYAFLLFHHSL